MISALRSRVSTRASLFIASPASLQTRARGLSFRFVEPHRKSLLSLTAGDTSVSTAKRLQKKQDPSACASRKHQQNTAVPSRRKKQPPNTHFISTEISTLRRNTKSNDPPLPAPTVVFSNNHLLFVNKPAGYHSQPNESFTDRQLTSRKCLLSKLKARGLGGGSLKNFLLPMHRLDQPCTGILMLAKNSKAGTRTGNAFRKHLVEKDYLCVVIGTISDMIQRSETIYKKNGHKMYQLTGVSMPSKNKRYGAKHSNKGGNSVVFKPFRDGMNADDKQRVCSLEWELLKSISDNRHLVRVVTGTGAKHQVRAMMSQLAKSPLCGDLRYGASGPLSDQSVALHARSLRLPTVSLGDMDLKKMRFTAPIPLTWSKFFALTEAKVPTIDYTS